MTTIPFEEIDDQDDLLEVDLAAELEADTPELASSGVEDSFNDNDPRPDDDDDDDEPGQDTDQGEADRPKSKADCRSEAKMIVNTFDQLQINLLQYMVYPNVILKKGDYQKVERFRDNQRSIIDEDTMAAMDRWAEFERKCKELPLSKEEKDRLADPLSKMLHKWQKIEVSPEMTLIFVLCLVMLPRLQPMFPLFFKKVDGMFG